MHSKFFIPYISLQSLLLGIPLLIVFVASVSFFIGLPVAAWQGLIPIVIGGYAAYKHDFSAHGKKVSLFFCYCLLFFCSWIFASIFLCVDSYDSTICHRPAVIILARGWNPVYQATMEAVQQFLGTDATGISLKHIIFQPKSIWIYGAVMYRMTGIATADLSLFILFFAALYAFTLRFSMLWWPSSTKLLRHLLALTILAMPKITQAMTGQIDNVLYAMAVLYALSLFTFVKYRQKQDLFIASICLIWLMITKISGLSTVIIIGILASISYFLHTPKKKLPIALRKFFYCTISLCIFVIIMDFSPYITNSIHYGGPLYPAHSFKKEFQHKDSDLTNDFTGNADSDQMGHVGRVAYAYFSKSMTCLYYRLKLGQSSFTPEFRVAEGCDGFKTVFRFIMILGFICWICSKRSLIDYLIIALLLSAVLLPTKYIGYARYATQIWITPFLMLFNWSCQYSIQYRGKYIYVAKTYVVPVLFGIYITLVFGRMFLFCIYQLHHSEQCWKELSTCIPATEIIMATSVPPPNWDTQNSLKISHPGPLFPFKVLLTGLMPKAVVPQIRFLQSPNKISLPLQPQQRIFLFQHGRFLLNGTKEEFNQQQKIQPPVSPSTVLSVPYMQTLISAPEYLWWNASQRLYNVFDLVINQSIHGLN